MITARVWSDVRWVRFQMTGGGVWASGRRSGGNFVKIQMEREMEILFKTIFSSTSSSS